jgi:hypothetical protein
MLDMVDHAVFLCTGVDKSVRKEPFKFITKLMMKEFSNQGCKEVPAVMLDAGIFCDWVHSFSNPLQSE